jgi:hypothetical protein
MGTLAQCGWSCTVTLGPQNMTEYLPLSALGYCWAILSNSLFHIGLQRAGTALHSIGYPVGNCMLSQASGYSVDRPCKSVSHASCTGNTHTVATSDDGMCGYYAFGIERGEARECCVVSTGSDLHALACQTACASSAL